MLIDVAIVCKVVIYDKDHAVHNVFNGKNSMIKWGEDLYSNKSANSAAHEPRSKYQWIKTIFICIPIHFSNFYYIF